MAGYDFAAIETKWQQYWAEHETFRQPNPGEAGFQDRPKLYVLDMFPYPSGAGLHVGHPEGYTATDIVSRYGRMKGYNVLHPMGYDSFGLPAEQYAVEHGVHPRQTTAANIANIERQIKMFGFSYDWSRRLATTDPEYYRWTQWIFLQLFNSWYDPDTQTARPIRELTNKLQSGELMVGLDGRIAPSPFIKSMDMIGGGGFGVVKYGEMSFKDRRAVIDQYRLAYQAEVPVNWCPQLGTVLANEEVTNEGKSDRGNFPVYRRALKQWMLRITAYAERLEKDLELLDWPEPIKIMQRNWIGKSVGAEVDFVIEAKDPDETVDEWFDRRQERGMIAEPEENVIRVYTTRPDTLYGATYMVLAPEHELVEQITTPDQLKNVMDYVRQAANKSDMDRMTDTKEKTGVFTGAYAINPVTQQPIPVWVADYVMMGYGTGAIMAVPAHDTRDFEFAEKFKLPIVQVVQPPEGVDWHGYVDDGVAVNSDVYNGMPTQEFKARITADLAEAGLGRAATNYKLRDWLFSRQRYWGEPFPVIHCDVCGTVALDERDLPLTLPEMSDFTPMSSTDPNALPQPPLGKVTDWVNAVCPLCGAMARRELNTMPQWAGSCWYYLRYLDPKNDKAFCDPKIEKYWMTSQATHGKGVPLQSPMGIDLYVGGAEHAVLHLLYARFWHKVLFDLGHVSTPEPFGKLFNQGMITSFTYRDQRGVSMPYDKIDFSGDKAVLKETGEALTVAAEKMSKSLKNVINPDDIIGQYGADTFRLYEMFMGPLEGSKPWNTRDIPGVHRFLQRVWRMTLGSEDQKPLLSEPRPEGSGPDDLDRPLHRLVKKAGEDIEAMKFNTTIAAMMDFVNQVYKVGRIARNQAETFLLVLAPFAPHVAEELWQQLGHDGSLAHEPWPTYDPALVAAQTIEMPVQVNGKLKGRIQVAPDADEATILAAATAAVQDALAGKTIVKKIVVPKRMVNLVVK
jgi:leucyl-tRNA synthetase